MKNEQVGEHGHRGYDDHQHPQPGPEVTVSVDDATKRVHRGSYMVSDFKDKVDVDASLQLAQVIDGQLTGLDDGARIVIKGGEVFFTRVRKGSSS